MKNLEENLLKIVESIDNIVQTQRSVQEFMQGQLEANEFLAKRIKELETRVLMAENSTLIPTKEVFNADFKRD